MGGASWGEAGREVDELATFLHGLGIVVLEGYGLTESTTVATFNRPHEYRLGSVGLPLPGVDVRLAPDGEVLVRGDNVSGGTTATRKRPAPC